MPHQTSKFSLIVRSTLFNLIFFLFSIIYPIFAILFFWLPRKKFLSVCEPYFKIIPVFEKYILGLTYELIGQNNIPKGPCVIAMKHQSTWETLKIINMVEDPIIIYKKTLHWLPGFGWCMMRLDMLPIDRSKGSAAIKQIVSKAKMFFKANRQIVIFPQGTCVPPGQKHPYKYGVAAIYAEHDVPVVPVALNSGVFWKKGSFIKYPGKITMKILEPIQPGMSADLMIQQLENTIETESDRLLKNYKGIGYAL